jgi:hypothetical protein
VKKYVLLFCTLAGLYGCTELRPSGQETARPLEPVIVYPSFGSNYLLSCLSDMHSLGRQDFDAKFELAEAALQHGRELETLHFICLSLNEKADYKQFQHGTKVLEHYLENQPDSTADMQGFLVLVDRLDKEIVNRWSAWKSLLNDKEELKAKVESLKVTIEELQKQIDQLKNIENIIKSRETVKS